jgi:hypothetical protein
VNSRLRIGFEIHKLDIRNAVLFRLSFNSEEKYISGIPQGSFEEGSTHPSTSVK